MALVNTAIDNSPLVYRAEKTQNGLLTLAGADAIVRGTVLARDSVSGKYVLFAVGGSTNENGSPKFVLLEDVTSTGAGDSACHVLLKGKVNSNKLVVDAAGDNSTLTAAHYDVLRTYGIDVEAPQQLSGLDNS